MRDANDQTMVVVFGGEAKGIESWNPLTGSSKILSNETLPEAGSSYGLMDSFLITINGGKDVLIFGGQTSQYYMAAVWIYNLVSS
jgi:hypothetical protein